MRSLHCHSQVLPLHPQFKRSVGEPSFEVLRFASTRIPKRGVMSFSTMTLRATFIENALSCPLLLDLRPLSKSGDIAGFLQISAGLLCLYWVANFVVPDVISRYYKWDKLDEDQDE